MRTSPTGSTRCSRCLPPSVSARSAERDAPRVGVGAEGDVGWGLGPGSEIGVGLGARRDRADADLLVVEQREPRGERALREAARELLAQRLLPRLVLSCGELRIAEKLADPCEEDGLEGGERQVASVGGRVGRVAGEAAREEA